MCVFVSYLYILYSYHKHNVLCITSIFLPLDTYLIGKQQLFNLTLLLEADLNGYR